MINILFHGDCFDGFGGAYVADLWNRKVLAPLNNGIPPVMKFYACKYGDRTGQELPEGFDSRDDVFIIDFSFPREQLDAFAKTVHSILVLDHHKTAQEQLDGLPYAIFDMNQSGAVLAWKHFFPDMEVPLLLQYVQDRDLWRFELPDSAEVNAYIMSFPKTVEAWDTLMETPIEQMVAEGRAITRYDNQKVEEICAQATFAMIGGHEVPVVNCNYQFVSKVGHRLLELYPTHPFSTGYSVGPDLQVRFSLRSRKGPSFFDVSEVAKHYKGGGHANASGFEMSLHQLEDCLGHKDCHTETA